VPNGSVCYVYADPNVAQNGIYVLRAGNWLNTMGTSGQGALGSYKYVLASDSTDALQAAVNGLPGGGGTLFLQSGTHTLDASRLVTNLAKLTLVGDLGRSC
jgi:hypothetical protein